MDLGAMDCLINPFQIEELIEKINKAIQKEGRTTFTISLPKAMPSHPALECEELLREIAEAE
jgi:DNA-binding response OmpR family regulator